MSRKPKKTKRRNKILKILGILVLIVGIIGISIFGYNKYRNAYTQSKQFLTPVFYRDGKIVKTGGKELATVEFPSGDRIEEITDVSFIARVKNTGEVPLLTKVSVETTPESLYNSFSQTPVEIGPGETYNFETSPITTGQFVDKTVTFYVKFEQTFECPEEYTVDGTSYKNEMCVQSDGTEVSPGTTGTVYTSGSLTYSFFPDMATGQASVSSEVQLEGATGEESGSGTTVDCLVSGSSCSSNNDCCSGSCVEEVVSQEEEYCSVLCDTESCCNQYDGCSWDCTTQLRLECLEYRCRGTTLEQIIDYKCE